MLFGPMDFEESRLKLISVTSTAVTGERESSQSFYLFNIQLVIWDCHE